MYRMVVHRHQRGIEIAGVRHGMVSPPSPHSGMPARACEKGIETFEAEMCPRLAQYEI